MGLGLGCEIEGVRKGEPTTHATKYSAAAGPTWSGRAKVMGMMGRARVRVRVRVRFRVRGNPSRACRRTLTLTIANPNLDPKPKP